MGVHAACLPKKRASVKAGHFSMEDEVDMFLTFQGLSPGKVLVGIYESTLLSSGSNIDYYLDIKLGRCFAVVHILSTPGWLHFMFKVLIRI